ncbi:SPOR domain-containing protein [Altererythrobacter sp. TH136]|uniref:SPOR domain-containing protein n=1 Tax=Altererythrobacter sp. TH136 TaxID=2067415 RepID=UPI0011655EA3|nr:SPOR domain-containing protein [Altererythrobacter sp. TH136]QDM41531.1 sporulation protein [Altererythrobacter sp. TH136]
MRLTHSIAITMLAAGLALASIPAHADVKAGVDAWASGDFARAIAEWKGPAAKGDADALFNLAQAYRLGRGVPENIAEAESLYARAAAKGHLKAADNYGLLLFQDGRREQALPYVTAAAERGDPRAQYLLGIAYFNGDLVVRDWVRAYALLTLANAADLPQARPAIQQMDEFVPLAQRQQAQSLAAQMRAQADAIRTAQLSAADLGQGFDGVVQTPVRTAAVQGSQPIAGAPAPLSVASAEAAVAEAMRATGTESPADAGADFARPARAQVAAAPPVRERAQVQAARAASPARAEAPDTSGPWKVQLGAFAVAGNADRLWSQLTGRSVLSGKSKVTMRSGRLTRLLAAGWATQGDAQGACNALKAAGQGCIVTR